jgi:hypothetical protein
MSDDYTPTTAEVRDAYREQSDGCGFPTHQDYIDYKASGGGEGEFDRWLAEYTRQVAEKAVIEHKAEPAPWMCEYCKYPFPKESFNPGKWSRCEICNGDEFVPNPASTALQVAQEAPHE